MTLLTTGFGLTLAPAGRAGCAGVAASRPPSALGLVGAQPRAFGV